MLERNYDPTHSYRVARYGRMSDPKQNKRSPDQQFATIDETAARSGYPWVFVTTYRDDGISGRYVRKRPGLQRMLRDIEAGLLQIDLIAVDTLERLGRAEEIAELRRKLFLEYGVLVVAADNHFADPTGVVGKAVGLVENIRSTEDGRIKAHNVIRGKKDAARLKRWPGGPPPFGYRLKAVVNESVSPPDVYNVLEHEPRQAAAQRLAFEKADETGEGSLRLTQWWNDSAEIPADFKPINPFTMAYRLKNPIYIGTLRWGANRTGIVNDTRVVETNPDGPELIADFCPPLVSVELYERVRRLAQTRGERIMANRRVKEGAGEGPAKLIAPQARGLTLKYLLTGLVRCGCCNASMRAVPGGRRSKAGKMYVYYVCPRHYDGVCPNGRYVPEDQLRETVIGRLRARLFPPPGPDGRTPAWLPELLGLVGQEHQRIREDEPGRDAAERDELRQSEQQLAGWAMTLGNPQLPASVRADIEARYAHGQQRQQELLQSGAARQARRGHLDRTLDPAVVVEELHRLAEVLAAHNPTLANLEISKHIDVIICRPDGSVELRGTFVGLFAGAVELLRHDDASPVKPLAAPDGGGYAPVTPRRRGRLKTPTLSSAGREGLGDADTALDPNRFAGLPDAFVWTDSFMLTSKPSWAQAHAEEVGRMRASGATIEELARHFGKTPPTIRQALQYAREKDPTLADLPAKMTRRWQEDHSAEVVKLTQEGLSILQIARKLGKSEPTIRKAVRFAAEAGTTTTTIPESPNEVDPS